LCGKLQIYKDNRGYCYAVGELLNRAPEKEDLFLREVRIKIFKRTGTLVLLEAMDRVSDFIFNNTPSINILSLQLVAVPLLHACLAEIPQVCMLQYSAHSVREERQVVYT
jgi:hypothetical protein